MRRPCRAAGTSRHLEIQRWISPKEAADIILLEKEPDGAGGWRDRRPEPSATCSEYLQMTASSTSATCSRSWWPAPSAVPANAADPSLLLQNLMCDISQTAIPFDNVDEKLLKKRSSGMPTAGRFMVFFGPISSLFRASPCSPSCGSSSRPNTLTSNAVPVRLVRGRPAVADPDRAHDPHTPDSFPAKPRGVAIAGHEREWWWCLARRSRRWLSTSSCRPCHGRTSLGWC